MTAEDQVPGMGEDELGRLKQAVRVERQRRQALTRERFREQARAEARAEVRADLQAEREEQCGGHHDALQRVHGCCQELQSQLW